MLPSNLIENRCLILYVRLASCSKSYLEGYFLTNARWACLVAVYFYSQTKNLQLTKQRLHKVLKYLIGLVWLVNGLFCKVLNYVPRHQEIVGEILGFDHAYVLTKAIGASEILMAIWIFSGLKSRVNAILQIVIIAAMNILEFTLIHELLLWGRFNILFATLMILVIYYNEFILKKKLSS